MLLKNKTIRKIRDRKGATTVEFAFVAPIFFLVIFTCFEFARMSMMRNLAQNAAYEACRFAMMEGATEEDGEQVAAGVLARLGTKDAIIETTYQPILRDDGSVVEDRAYVTTRITVPLANNSIALPATVFGDNNIVTETQLRSERYIGHFQSQNSN